MDVNELMIGDLVYGMPYDDFVYKIPYGDFIYEIPYGDPPKHITIVDINVLMIITSGSFYKEVYEPIPITDEILNLNFKTPAQPDIWCLGPDSENYIFNDDGKYLLNICDEDYNYFIDHFPIRYVHELQHFLRLCGLNDIADNFKVE